MSEDDGINRAVSQGLVELFLAGNSARHSRSSSNAILTIRVGRKFSLQIAFWNFRTLLQKGKLENIKHEMAWFG